jgi:hypothetical protein
MPNEYVLANDENKLTEHATVSGFFLRMLDRYAMERGVERPGPPSGVDLEAHVPARQFLDMWEAVRRDSGDVDFGLHIGEFLARCGDQHAVGHLLVHCNTVGDALQTLCQVHSVLVEVVQPRLEDGCLSLFPALGDRHLTEAVFANLNGDHMPARRPRCATTKRGLHPSAAHDDRGA